MSQNQIHREWYLLNCKPKQDQRAEENLNNQGYITFRPTLTLKKKRRNKEVLVQESLFPRYLFIYLDKENDNWAPISSTLGVGSIVRFGQELAQVPEDVISSLKVRSEFLKEQPAGEVNRFEIGERVLLSDGPFKGLSGVLSSYSGEERVIVLLNILAEDARVAVPSTSVKKYA